MATYTHTSKKEGDLIRFQLKDHSGKVVADGTGPGVSEAEQDGLEKTKDDGAKAWLLQMKYPETLVE
jgi:hypothetical protein